MRILIRLPNWLGDVAMSTAFTDAIRQLYPDAIIDVIAKRGLGDIAQLIPGIRTVHEFSKQDFKGLAGAYRFGSRFRSEKYDLFFNLPSSLSSLMLGWATGSAGRVGFKAEGGFLFLTKSYKRPQNLHRVDEYISLLQQFTGREINSRRVILNMDNALPVNGRRVIVNFNSEAESRRMPVEKGAALINLLTDTFKDVIFTLIGAPGEATFIQQLLSKAKYKDNIENYAGKTTLLSLISLMASSAAVLTTDSGPAHLANAVGTPTIVLFGAGNEHNTSPYNKQDLSIIRYSRLACEPCVKNTCNLYGIPKCMELIDELQIIAALSLYLPHVK